MKFLCANDKSLSVHSVPCHCNAFMRLSVWSFLFHFICFCLYFFCSYFVFMQKTYPSFDCIFSALTLTPFNIECVWKEAAPHSFVLICNRRCNFVLSFLHIVYRICKRISKTEWSIKHDFLRRNEQNGVALSRWHSSNYICEDANLIYVARLIKPQCMGTLNNGKMHWMFDA